MTEKIQSKQIIPGIGAAGLQLGDSETEVYRIWGNPKERKLSGNGILCLYYANLRVWLDTTGRVARLALEGDYEGQSDLGLRLGLHHDWFNPDSLIWSELEEAWYWLSYPGTLLEFDESDVIEANQPLIRIWIMLLKDLPALQHFLDLANFKS